MNNVKMSLFGTLGKDPESRYTDNSKMVTSVSAAVETGSGDYKKTTWYKLTIWGEKAGEMFTNMCKKGSFVYAEGVPSLEVWKDKEGEAVSQINVNVNEWRILRNGKSREEAQDNTPFDGE